MATQTMPTAAEAVDTFPINGTDYIEFYVGNAKQASLYYRAAFGFQLVGYRGPETGTRDRASYLLQQNKIRFVLTSAIRPGGDIAEHVAAHGDGVKDLALWVDDARELYRLALERGAESVREPTVLRDERGEIVVAINARLAFGDGAALNRRFIRKPGVVDPQCIVFHAIAMLMHVLRDR